MPNRRPPMVRDIVLLTFVLMLAVFLAIMESRGWN